MSDKFSREIRSKIMQAVKSRGTELENTVMRCLYQHGIRYRRNVYKLPGAPDIAIKKLKTVIFIDSCFWHGCTIHFRLPQTNQEYWRLKIAKNKARDNKVSRYYLSQGWHVQRIWEHELKQDFGGTINRLIEFIESQKRALPLKNEEKET